MDIEVAISLSAILLSWRFLASLAIAGALAVPVWQLVGPVGGLAVVLAGVGFGCMWQGRWLSGIPVLAPTPAPSISKPVAFLGLAFIGAIWGGFASEVLGSVAAGACALIAAVAAVGAWQTVILKRNMPFGKFMFSAMALLFGLVIVFVASELRG